MLKCYQPNDDIDLLNSTFSFYLIELNFQMQEREENDFQDVLNNNFEWESGYCTGRSSQNTHNCLCEIHYD